MTTTIAQSAAVPVRSKGSVYYLYSAMAAWVFVLLLSTLSVTELKAPEPVPATAPATEFSAERAISYVKEIARTPHPIGSPAAAEVRKYLLAQLSALGLNPQIVSAIGTHNAGRTFVVGNTQ